MKKAYAAPSFINNGDVVRETLSEKGAGPESPTTQSLTAGTVGFYL